MPELSKRTESFTDSVIRRMTRISIENNAVNLSQEFPDFEPPKELRHRLAEIANKDFHQYSITWGAQNFREALARKQTRFMGRNIDPNNEIVVTCGSTEAMMAAMLLVGTNAWATTHEVATDAQFETAWKTASSGDVIKLTDAITLTKTMWLGTQNMNDASRKIEIDLNGYNLLSSVQYPFLLTHGTLKISNTRPESGQVQGTYTKYSKGVFSGSANLFYVTGSTNKDVDPSEDGVNYYTHLEIGEGVIVTQAHYDALISVVELNRTSVAQKAYAASACVPEKPALTYITNVYAGMDGKNYKTDVAAETNPSKAVAHGVRIDVKGTINATKYGIKTKQRRRHSIKE